MVHTIGVLVSVGLITAVGVYDTFGFSVGSALVVSRTVGVAVASGSRVCVAVALGLAVTVGVGSGPIPPRTISTPISTAIIINIITNITPIWPRWFMVSPECACHNRDNMSS